LYLIEITYDGSHVLIMCVIGVWRHILDLWCVCAVHTHTTGPEYAVKHRSRT